MEKQVLGIVIESTNIQQLLTGQIENWSQFGGKKYIYTVREGGVGRERELEKMFKLIQMLLQDFWPLTSDLWSFYLDYSDRTFSFLLK